MVLIYYSFCLILGLWAASFLITLLIKVKPQTADNKRERVSSRLLLSGWKYVYSNKLYRTLFLNEIMHALAFGVWAQFVFRRFIAVMMGFGTEEAADLVLSHLNGAYKLGGVVGGVLIVWFIARQISSLPMLRLDAISNIFLILLFVFFPYFWVTLLLSILMGITHSLRLTAYHTLIQYNTWRNKLPEVYAVYKMILLVSTIVGSTIMSAIVDQNIYLVYILAAVFFTCSAFFLNRVPKEVITEA